MASADQGVPAGPQGPGAADAQVVPGALSLVALPPTVLAAGPTGAFGLREGGRVEGPGPAPAGLRQVAARIVRPAPLRRANRAVGKRRGLLAPPPSVLAAPGPEGSLPPPEPLIRAERAAQLGVLVPGVLAEVPPFAGRVWERVPVRGLPVRSGTEAVAALDAARARFDWTSTCFGTGRARGEPQPQPLSRCRKNTPVG